MENKYPKYLLKMYKNIFIFLDGTQHVSEIRSVRATRASPRQQTGSGRVVSNLRYTSMMIWRRSLGRIYLQ